MNSERDTRCAVFGIGRSGAESAPLYYFNDLIDLLLIDTNYVLLRLSDIISIGLTYCFEGKNGLSISSSYLWYAGKLENSVTLSF